MHFRFNPKFIEALVGELCSLVFTQITWKLDGLLVVYSWNWFSKNTEEKSALVWWKKTSVSHILIKIHIYHIEIEKQKKIVANFITWIFRNYDLIRAGIEQMRKSKHIFYDFRQKRI